jgi:hypothetical protein
MKSVASGIILAVVLFVIALVAWNEAKITRDVAASHQRIATLHFDDDPAAEEGNLLDRLPLPGSSRGDIEQHRAQVNYWLARYEALKSLTGATGTQPASDPTLRYIAANGAYRASHPEVGDKKSAVERLDAVMQEYADVLRADPEFTDAAYNYEYVVRIRDILAKGHPAPKAYTGMQDTSVDLPNGPTLHGRPGFPPETVPMSDFKTVSPMRFDEREEQQQPGKGKAPVRKG